MRTFEPGSICNYHHTEVNGEPIVAAVISTNGSARNAKLAALREIPCLFQVKVAVAGPSRGTGAIDK